MREGTTKMRTTPQDPSPTAADSYYDETFEDFDTGCRVLPDLGRCRSLWAGWRVWLSLCIVHRCSPTLQRDQAQQRNICQLWHWLMEATRPRHPPPCHLSLRDAARARRKQRKERAKVAPPWWNTLPGAKGKSPIPKGERKPAATRLPVWGCGQMGHMTYKLPCAQSWWWCIQAQDGTDRKHRRRRGSTAMWSSRTTMGASAMTAQCWTLAQVPSCQGTVPSIATCWSSRRPTTTSPRSSSCVANAPSTLVVMPAWSAPGLFACPYASVANTAMCRCTCCLVRHPCCLEDRSWNPLDWSWTAAAVWSSSTTCPGNMLWWVPMENTSSPCWTSLTPACGNFHLPLNLLCLLMEELPESSWTFRPSTLRSSSSTPKMLFKLQPKMICVRRDATCSRPATPSSLPLRTSSTPTSPKSCISLSANECSGKSTAVEHASQLLQKRWAWMWRSSATRLAGTSTCRSTRISSCRGFEQKCRTRSIWHLHATYGARCRTWPLEQKPSSISSISRGRSTTHATWCLWPGSTKSKLTTRGTRTSSSPNELWAGTQQPWRIYLAIGSSCTSACLAVLVWTRTDSGSLWRNRQASCRARSPCRPHWQSSAMGNTCTALWRDRHLDLADAPPI